MGWSVEQFTKLARNYKVYKIIKWLLLFELACFHTVVTQII